jgi:hypothetical protein
VGTLIALAHQNDPFNISPARVRAAQWFYRLWRRYEMGTGIHVRRVHYLLISQPVRDVNGRRYTNDTDHWNMLARATRDARYLGLVPRGTFIDRKNDAPIINVINGADIFISDSEPGVAVETPDMPDLPKLWLDRPTINQRYHIELWCEKTTINDVLEPLAAQYACNVVTGSGELSLTACEDVVDRALESDRLVRILYISDFDPGGMSMPVAVARKIEYRIRNEDLDLDLQVRPIALTHEQCIEYELPRTPIKETERRAARFEERFGAGASELDAMEALHPGELRKIIEREILRYYDNDLAGKIARVIRTVERDIDGINESVHDSYTEEVVELRDEWQRIIDDFESRVDDWRERAEEVWSQIADDLNECGPDLTEIEWPEPDEGDEDDDPMFDSTRDYVEQIDRYKDHQEKPTEGKICK